MRNLDPFEPPSLRRPMGAWAAAEATQLEAVLEVEEDHVSMDRQLPEELLKEEEVRPIKRPSPKILATFLVEKTIKTYWGLENVHPIVRNLFCPQNTLFPLGGRLRHFVQHWEKLTRNPAILEIVKGWEIPLLETPYQAKPPQMYHSNRIQEDLISKEVASMLEKGAIQLVQPVKGQILSNIFLREKKGAPRDL